MKSDTQLENSTSLIRDVAARMQEPSRVVEQICRSSNQSPLTNASPWAPLTLSHGYPGILLLFATLDRCFPDERWDEASHQYVLKIKETIEKDGLEDFSLFSGLAGICCAIDSASKGKTRYQRLLNTLNHHLISQVRASFFPLLREKIQQRFPARMEIYDLISGISGIGCYLISQSDQEEARECLCELLGIAVGLTQDIQVGPHHVPGWYVPCDYQFLERDKRKYPNGNFNLGLSHGVTGLLALLSLALIHGIIVEGQKEAIEKVSGWIIAKKVVDQGHIYWTDRISFAEEIENRVIPSKNAAAAWCYGTAGIARCLYLTAKALNDKTMKDLGVSAFQSIFTRIEDHWALGTSSFCHGNAGILTLTCLMAHDTDSDVLKGWIPKIRQKILQEYCAGDFFGFKDREPIFKEDGPLEMCEIEKAGLLDGTAGILLSLLTSVNYQTSWTLPFLIGE